MMAYFNEIDPAAAHVLECLIKDGVIADGIVDRRSIVDDGREPGRLDAHAPRSATPAGFWDDYEWRTGADGKARRVKPGVRLLVDGWVGRVALLRILGNAIVPQVAQAFIQAVMETINACR